MTTLTAYADAADEYLNSLDPAYATARSGGTLSVSPDWTSVLEVGQRYYDTTGEGDFAYAIREGFVGFDTSAIGDTDAISAAVLNVTSFEDNSDTDFTIQARLSDWGTSVTTADWVAGGSLSGLTLLATYATSSGFTANTAYDLASETAFTSNVNKTGSTRMLLCSSRTVGNNTPTGSEYVGIKSADTTGTTSDPKLTVTYSAGGATWEPRQPACDFGTTGWL